jgi:hypothetical protein
MVKNGKFYEDNVDVHIAISPIALVTRLAPMNKIFEYFFVNFAPIV